MTILNSLPLWALFIATAIVFLAAYEIGHMLGRRRREQGTDENVELGSLVGAMLGMLGFIIAITFGAQLARFDAAKSSLLDEATAIYTTFLRADMLAEDARKQTRRLLYRYAQTRSDTDRDVFERIAESEALQQQIWDISIAAADQMPAEFPRELYFESLNLMIEIHEKRVTLGISQKMPGVFWLVLYMLASFSFAVTGYHGGVASGSRVPIRPVAVAGFALLVLLIADLDRQGEGSLKLDQSALRDVAARMSETLSSSDAGG